MLFAEEGKRGNKNGRSVQHVKYCIVLLSLGEPWTLLEIQDPAHLQHVLPVFSVITVSTRRGRRPAICAAHRTSSLSFMLWACRPRWNEIGQVCGDEVCHVSGLGCHCEWYVWFVTTDYLNFKLKVVGSNN